MKNNKAREETAISDSFLKAAISDINSAKILLKNKEYSNSLYHSQQAIEKILKAMLALKGRFIFKHEVIAEFCKVFKKTVSQDFINLVKDEGFTRSSRREAVSDIQILAEQKFSILQKNSIKKTLKKATERQKKS